LSSGRHNVVPELAQFGFVELFFDPQAIPTHGETEGEINRDDEKVAFQFEGPPVGVGIEREAQRTSQLI
jgi:hypothetical protein